MERLSQLHDQARMSALSEQEFDEVARCLKESSDNDIKRKCIIILRREASSKREDLVFPLLESSDLPLRGEVIRFLIRDLKKAAEYLSIFIKFLDGVEEDAPLNVLQLDALQVAGEAYRSTLDVGILQRILHFLEHGRKAFRNSASDSLVRALTEDYETLSPKERYEIARDADLDKYREKALNIIGHAS